MGQELGWLEKKNDDLGLDKSRIERSSSGDKCRGHRVDMPRWHNYHSEDWRPDFKCFDIKRLFAAGGMPAATFFSGLKGEICR
jgi:hypothetical protein